MEVRIRKNDTGKGKESAHPNNEERQWDETNRNIECNDAVPVPQHPCKFKAEKENSTYPLSRGSKSKSKNIHTNILALFY